MLITAPAADDDDEDQFKPMPKGPGTKKVIISLGHKNIYHTTTTWTLWESEHHRQHHGHHQQRNIIEADTEDAPLNPKPNQPSSRGVLSQLRRRASRSR